MTHSSHPQIEEPSEGDLVQLAIDSLQRDVSGRSPGDRLAADTLTALRRAEAQQPVRVRQSSAASRGFWQKVVGMTMTQKIAAAVCTTLIGLTIYFFLGLVHGLGSVSYAEVVGHLRAHTLTCNISAGAPGGPVVTFKLYAMDPGHMRMDLAQGQVMITDSMEGGTLLLDTVHKAATATQFPRSESMKKTARQEGLLESLRQLVDLHGTPAEQKQIGTITAQGFHVEQGSLNCMVYADPKTTLPIEIDMRLPGMAMGTTFNNFQFDPDLDADLFSLTPPAGYTVQTRAIPAINLSVEENVGAVLRAYAEHNDGVFPPSLFDWADLGQKIRAWNKPSTSPPAADPQLKKASNAIGVITAELSGLKQGTQWDYLPAASKLGNGSVIVFWVQQKGTDRYRVIYGDMHVATVKEDQLPPRSIK